jgi:predicted hydrocarbon binding protein
MSCSVCGKTIPDESLFCLFCGTRLSQQQAAAITPPSRLIQQSLFYPNLIGRQYLVQLEQLVGHREIDALLMQANLRALQGNYPISNLQREFPFAAIAAISQATEIVYGTSRARELGLACGRALFRVNLQDFGALAGLFTYFLRLVPLAQRLHLVVKMIAGTFDRFSDQPTRVEKRSGRLFYITEKCAVCWERQSDHACCYLTQGILEEAAAWVAQGTSVRIEEIECRSTGGTSCTFAIDWRVGL